MAAVTERSDLTREMVERLRTWLATERRARGWSTQQAAERTGLSRSYINELERGRYDGRMPAATLDAVGKLAKGFGVPVFYLFDVIGGQPDALTPEEQQLLLWYRTAGPELRPKIVTISRELASLGEDRGFSYVDEPARVA